VTGPGNAATEAIARAIGVPYLRPGDALDFLVPEPSLAVVAVFPGSSAGEAAASIGPVAGTGWPVIALIDLDDGAARRASRAAGAALLVPWEAPLALLASLVGAVTSGPAQAGFGADLTRRESEILSELMDGRHAGEIAVASYVSLHTVRTQIKSLLRKLGVHSQLEAVALAKRVGWSLRD
jgi:DNA-binding NarL/FixJ family response regulator